MVAVALSVPNISWAASTLAGVMRNVRETLVLPRRGVRLALDFVIDHLTYVHTRVMCERIAMQRIGLTANRSGQP